MEILNTSSERKPIELILPDMSGLAQLIDDFELPSVESSLKDIVKANNKHNKKLSKKVDEHKIYIQETVKKIESRIDRKIEEIQSQMDPSNHDLTNDKDYATQIDELNKRLSYVESKLDEQHHNNLKILELNDQLDELEFTYKQKIDELEQKCKSISILSSKLDIIINQVSQLQILTRKDSNELMVATPPIDPDESLAPSIYYTVSPSFGDQYTESKGKVVINGNDVKLSGYVLVPTPIQGKLVFDHSKQYIADSIHECSIHYADQRVDKITIDELNSGGVHLDLTQINQSYYPVKITYKIRYQTRSS